jgi:pyruvate carboxylase
MKMQTTLYAHADGVVAEVNVVIGDSVDAGDLLVRLRA